MKKSEKGITLIVLVITIIVLLILAGVVISRVVKKDGVINKAHESAQETALASAEEEIQNVVNPIVTLYLADPSKSGSDLATEIDTALRELATNGSKVNGITYEYTGLNNDGDNESDSDDLVDDSADSGAKAAQRVLAEDSSKPLISEDRIETLYARYKGEVILRGVLNMRTGNFNIEYGPEKEPFEPAFPIKDDAIESEKK